MLVGVAMVGLFITSSSAAEEVGEASSFAEAFFISHSVDAEGGRRIEWLGSLVIWLLLATSVASLGLIGQLAASNRPQRIMPGKLRKQAANSLQQGRYRETLTMLGDDSSDFARVLHGGLSKASGGFTAMQRGLERAAGEVVARRNRPVEILNVIGQVSPMLGLFGTVYGMILAFQSIVTSGGNADPVLLAGGIGTALVTTFWGLVVAIPALAGYAAIRGRLDSSQAEAINEAANIMDTFRVEVDANRSLPATPTESGNS